MHYKKLISLWALLALMFGQVSLAHHSATHIDHGASQNLIVFNDADHGHEHEHDEEHKKKTHACPQCVLTKSLQTAFYNSFAVLLSVPQTETILPTQQSYLISSNHFKANAPRAPPAILI